jgi:hypothetical protein
MGGDPGQVHAPGAVLDEEQYVQAAQEDGIDVEEVDGASVRPRPVSSPWMRRYPPPGLSRAIFSTSARIACAVLGRPGARRG